MDLEELESRIRQASKPFGRSLLRVAIVGMKMAHFHIRPKRDYQDGMYDIQPQIIKVLDASLHRKKAWPHPISQMTSIQSTDEWAWVNENGFVLEAQWSNVWLEQEGVVYTPPLTEPLLNGIMRTAILVAAEQLSVPIIEAPLLWNDSLPWVLSSCAKTILHTKGADLSPELERIKAFIRCNQHQEWLDSAISARLSIEKSVIC